ncbi:MAG: flagellar export protein FliJ [Spirochaetaceae bacterium]|nr:flagellar export protein FliJ [Spirochaetaceae bacterium]
MKAFKFSLQKILDLRLFAEEQAKLALAAAIAESDRIKNSLKEIAQSRVEANHERSVCTDITGHIAIENYINRLDIRKEELLEELASAELVVEEKRAAYNEAMKQRKVLSNLKDKKFAEYKKQYNKAAEIELDDMNQARYQPAE